VEKLFKMKEWLTLTEAAQRLSILFGEDVNVADVLRLALDGHLKLSVRFVNGATARCGRVIPLEEAETYEIPENLLSGKPNKMVKGLLIREGEILALDETIVTIWDVWDLPMIGEERLDVEHEYQRLTNGPEVTAIILSGALVESQDGQLCELQESFNENEYKAGSKAQLRELKERIARDNIGPPQAKELLNSHKENREKFLQEQRDKQDSGKNSANYYPAGRLPTDSVLVVRTTAIQELVSRISEPVESIEKPMGQRERTTLLVIIGALAKLANIDLSKPSKAAGSIENETALMGVRVAARTIENHLKRVPEAMENRSQR
jgi:hypothetical protein